MKRPWPPRCGTSSRRGWRPAADRYWSELGIDSPSAPTWPEGVVSLAEHVRAPPRLARRLRFIGVVGEASAAERVAATLAPGARLVSKGGGLWRWDGFVAPEGALLPAAVRLRDLARIEALSAAAAKAEPAAKIAKSEHAQAREALMRFERTRGDARRGIGPADTRERETRQRLDILQREEHRRLDRLSALREVIESLEADAARLAEEAQGLSDAAAPSPEDTAFEAQAPALRATVAEARRGEAEARVAVERHASERHQLERRRIQLIDDLAGWERRAAEAKVRLDDLAGARPTLEAELVRAKAAPEAIEAERRRLLDTLEIGEARRRAADDALTLADTARREAEQAARAAETRAASAGEARAGADARLESAAERTAQAALDLREATDLEPAALETWLGDQAIATPTDLAGARAHLAALEREQAGVGPVNLLAEEEAEGVAARLEEMRRERDDLTGALSRLRRAIGELNAEARERLRAAFVVIDERFRDLFTTLFEGGAAELRLVDSEDPLEAGLEILACPPGKRMSVMSLMSGGEQALTAAALIFAVFLANPAPICVLDEVDAPLDDANVERFCNLLDEMRRRTATRFLTITHNPLTMSRMDRLFGVTMRERGVSQLVSVDLRGAEALRAA